MSYFTSLLTSDKSLETILLTLVIRHSFRQSSVTMNYKIKCLFVQFRKPLHKMYKMKFSVIRK